MPATQHRPGRLLGERDQTRPGESRPGQQGPSGPRPARPSSRQARPGQGQTRPRGVRPARPRRGHPAGHRRQPAAKRAEPVGEVGGNHRAFLVAAAGGHRDRGRRHLGRRCGGWLGRFSPAHPDRACGGVLGRGAGRAGARRLRLARAGGIRLGRQVESPLRRRGDEHGDRRRRHRRTGIPGVLHRGPRRGDHGTGSGQHVRSAYPVEQGPCPPRPFAGGAPQQPLRFRRR